MPKVVLDFREYEDVAIGVDEDGVMWFSCCNLSCSPDDFCRNGLGKTAEAINITH